jgi:pyrimidine-nucleoside phosphorylase
MSDFSMVELIERKRDGDVLSADELRWIIEQDTADRIPDYQMSSLLMAIVLNGMTAAELGPWTEAMLHSGDVVHLDHVAAPKVDKHSTGGVGDKASIPLAPLVAACGVAVPMMSGRGLGHTGGTLDKLETIPGFRTALDPTEFVSIVERHGMVLAGQSETMVPADRRIYALRDASGTVPSIDLISSSIMSKKLAEGLDALVLDVKVGSGAFMKEAEQATVLAETMVRIGASHDTEVVALLTDMDQPLGRAVGNANEVVESIEVLRGNGPADLVEITLRLGEEMLLVGGVVADRAEARKRLELAIDSGAALDKFREVVAAQDGDPSVVDDTSLLPQADHRQELVAARNGFVTHLDALAVGVAAVRLGAGRRTKADVIDPAVGFELVAKRGDSVEVGDPLVRVAYTSEAQLNSAIDVLTSAWVIGDEAPGEIPLVLGEVR